MAERFFAVARTEDLIVQEMGPETLVFDRRTDVAHNLSPIASVVWNLCDGKHDVDALVAAVAEIEPADAQAATEAALAELGELGLLIDGVSRRETMKKMAKFGAGAMSVPLILSITAPTAMAALSHTAGQSCTTNADCVTTLGLVCGTQAPSANKCCYPTGFTTDPTCQTNNTNNKASATCCSGRCGSGSTKTFCD